MNDPHVESLEYRFVPDPTRVYDNPPPLEGEGSGFAWRLADGLLTVTMKDHYAKEGEARSVVDGFVRGWELDLALKYGRREVHFEYQRANVINRAPTPGAVVLRAEPARVTLTGARATLTVTHRKYPEPPAALAVSADVETLWNRYEGYNLGREPLPSMAYFCLTFVQSLYGHRRTTAQALSIDFAVLGKLGELTSGRGGPLSARKAPFQPLSGQEAAWIETAVKALIRRVGTIAAGVEPSPRLTMTDLPKL